MKYALTIFTVLSALLTACLLIALIRLFIAWTSGGFNIVLPGLGLIVSGGLVLAVFFIAAVIMLALTVWLFRAARPPLR
jgi:hypothetical protein